MNWLDSLGSPILMIIGGIITWFIKARVEELKAIEEKLRIERRKIYDEILDPFIRLFVDLKGEGAQKAIKIMTSYEYRKSAFTFYLIGSDGVISANNKLMQYIYQTESTGKINNKKMLKLWGRLLLEIRKSLGNKRTKLDELDMLRAMIKDIDEL